MNAYVVFKDEGGVAKALERSVNVLELTVALRVAAPTSFVSVRRNGVEIEKDFYIRVDRVSGGSSVSQSAE